MHITRSGITAIQNRKSAQSETMPDRPISTLVVSWVLMIPLLYYAAVGGFWFQRAAGNNPLSQRYSTLVDAPQSGETTLTALCVFILVLVPFFSRMKSVFACISRDKVFAASVALAFVSCTWSQFPGSSLRWSLCLAVETILAFYLYQRFSHARLFSLLSMLGWLCLGLSIVLSIFLPNYGIDHSGTSVGGWQGIYGQKNTCSMVTFFLLASAIYAPAVTSSAKVLRAIFIGLSVFLILMTQSATGKLLLAFLLVYVIAMGVIKKFSPRDRAIILAGMLLVVVSLIVAVTSYSNQLTYLLGKDPTLSGRTEIWHAAMTSVLKRPILGYGYVAFWRGFEGESANVSLAIGWSGVYAHSGFLNILTTLGAAGVGLFLYSVLRAVRDAALCLPRENLPYVKWALCIVLSTLVLNVDEVTIMLPNHLLWILYIIACVGLSECAARVRYVTSGSTTAIVLPRPVPVGGIAWDVSKTSVG